jgi:hypothetical protein
MIYFYFYFYLLSDHYLDASRATDRNSAFSLLSCVFCQDVGLAGITTMMLALASTAQHTTGTTSLGPSSMAQPQMLSSCQLSCCPEQQVRKS